MTNENEIFNNLTKDIVVEETDFNPPIANNEWADEIFNNSSLAKTFEVEDTDFDPDTGNHYYISETSEVAVVTPDGHVMLEDDK